MAGFDDDRGDYNVVLHDHIAYRYEILVMLGKGSFGQVLFLSPHRVSCYSCAVVLPVLLSVVIFPIRTFSFRRPIGFVHRFLMYLLLLLLFLFLLLFAREQVVKCYDHKTGQHLAVKIIRNKKRFHHQALVEVRILEHIRDRVRVQFMFVCLFVCLFVGFFHFLCYAFCLN